MSYLWFCALNLLHRQTHHFPKRQTGTKLSLPHVSPCSQQETGAASGSTRTVNHRTSRPGREHHLIQSAHSPFCHFLAGPSSCLHPAGISATQQMAPLAWKTFTLSVSTWWKSLPSIHILYHQYGGGVVAQWLALAFHGNKVSFLVPVCGLAFTMCLCRGMLPPTTLWPVIRVGFYQLPSLHLWPCGEQHSSPRP